MSDRPVRVVYAPPPGKRPSLRSAAPRDTGPAVATAKPPAVSLTSSQAIAAVLDLIRQWKLPPARGWRMLTGLGYGAGSLTSDQIARVQHLMAIDAGLRTRMGNAVGDRMVTCDGPDMMSGAAPVDFLTSKGTSGYTALAGLVEQWMRV